MSRARPVRRRPAPVRSVMMATDPSESGSWDGYSWAEAEGAAEKMALRAPTLAVALAKALTPARRATYTGGNLATATEKVVIQAPVGRVYARISDVTQMGRWSPENIGATLVGGGTACRGAVFDGPNARGRLRWTTRCEVTVAEENECFAFKVKAIGWGRPLLRFPIATWTYRFQAIDAGTTSVSETWAVGPWPRSVIDAIEHWSADGLTGAEIQRRNMVITLRNLKRGLEAEAPT